MKVLWVIENNKKSANYKIGIKLANIMKKSHQIDCALFGGELDLKNDDIGLIFDSIYPIGACNNQVFADSEWQTMPKKSKMRYLMNNFNKALDFIEFKLSKRHKKVLNELNAICSDKKYDAIIGVVFPYEIAMLISELNCQSKKVIIQLDPYSGHKLLKEHLNARIEKEEKVLNTINYLFTTTIIKKEILNIHGLFEGKIESIEFPEMSSECFTKQFKKSSDSDYISFFYAGTFYKDIRNPKYLTNMFSNLPKNYILKLAGINCNMIDEYSNGILDRIYKYGFIDQNQVEKIRDDSDFLICFNNLLDNQVPSKLFECIETGKPFINLCQLRNCPTLPYVDGYENCLNVFTDDIDFDEIVEFVNKRKGKVISKEFILERYYKHTYEYVEGQIERVLING